MKVENVAQEGDPVKYKVSLEDKVQVGNVTIEGSTDNGNKIGEIQVLTNTTLNSADFCNNWVVLQTERTVKISHGILLELLAV